MLYFFVIFSQEKNQASPRSTECHHINCKYQSFLFIVKVVPSLKLILALLLLEWDVQIYVIHSYFSTTISFGFNLKSFFKKDKARLLPNYNNIQCIYNYYSDHILILEIVIINPRKPRRYVTSNMFDMKLF